MRTSLKLTTISTVVLMACSIATASVTKPEYKAREKQISAEYKADKAACDKLTANAKDVCLQEAKGKEKVAHATLEYDHTGKRADHVKAVNAQADATYTIAKEKCDDKTGNDKDVCVQEAKAAHTKALADSKLGSTVNKAQNNAADEKRDAEYKVEAEKCDALSSNAKSECMTNAKTKYGK